MSGNAEAKVAYAKIRFFGSTKSMRIFLIGLLLALTMTACGTKGPLYIPEQRYPQEAN
jgi:hypothetical protein